MQPEKLTFKKTCNIRASESLDDVNPVENWSSKAKGTSVAAHLITMFGPVTIVRVPVTCLSNLLAPGPVDTKGSMSRPAMAQLGVKRSHLVQCSAECTTFKLTITWSERQNQPEYLSWPECMNTPGYRGTYKMRSSKEFHPIMAIYLGSLHAIRLEFSWKVSAFCNAIERKLPCGCVVERSIALHFRYCLP